MRLPLAPLKVCLRELVRVMRPDRALLWTLVIVQCLAAGALVAVPWTLGHIIDLISAGAPRQKIVNLVILVALAVCVSAFLGYFADYLSRLFGERVFSRLRYNFMRTVTHLPLSTVEIAGTGDLVGRSNHDVNQLDFIVRSGISRMLVLVLTIVMTYAAAFFTSPLLAVMLLTSVVLMVPVMTWYIRRAMPGYQAELAQLAQVSGAQAETVDQARTVDALSLQRVRRAHIERMLRQLWGSYRYTAWLRVVLLVAFGVLSLLPLICVLVLGAWAMPRGLVTLGAVAAVALYAFEIRRPLGELSYWVDMFFVTSVSLARIFGVSQVPSDRSCSGEKPDGHGIAVRAVSYEYRPGRPVLHQVDLDLQPGETLAIVGPSGAGKSTLGRMLAGIHPPTEGSVTVGGVPLVDLSEEDLHDNVILVTQEHHVFVGTIAQNLQLAKADADAALMQQCLEAVGAWEWVSALENGLETEVGSGKLALTPAQAQQLALARIVMMDPHTLVLDEATSLLDPSSARELERSLAKVLRGRTVVAIAHRLYTAHDADRIVVMEEGRIVEVGSHRELVQLGGKYAALWKAWSYEDTHAS